MSNKFKYIRRLLFACLATLAMLSAIGCGGGGGGTTTPAPPTADNTWDNFNWDEGTWQ